MVVPGSRTLFALFSDCDPEEEATSSRGLTRGGWKTAPVSKLISALMDWICTGVEPSLTTVSEKSAFSPINTSDLLMTHSTEKIRRVDQRVSQRQRRDGAHRLERRVAVEERRVG